MRYNHKHQLKKLRESGRRAPAKVIDVHLQGTGDMDGLDLKHHPRAHWSDYKLELRVMPEGDEPFVVSVRTRWYPAVGGLWTDSDVEVLYDPAHPHDVVVDYEEPVDRWQAAQEAKVNAVREGTPPAFDRDAWIALVQEGEEAAENATDPKVAAEINDLVDRFDSGRVAEAEYKARLAQLAGPPGA